MLRKHPILAQIYITAKEQRDKAMADAQAFNSNCKKIIHFRITLLNKHKVLGNIVDPTLHDRQVNLPDPTNETFAIWCYNNDKPSAMPGPWLTDCQGRFK